MNHILLPRSTPEPPPTFSGQDRTAQDCAGQLLHFINMDKIVQ